MGGLHQAQQPGWIGHGLVGGGHDQIAAAQTRPLGRAIGQNGLNQGAIALRQGDQGVGVAVVLPGQAGRERHQLNPQVGMHHLGATAELAGHVLGQVDRNGESQASTGPGAHQGIDPHHLTGPVNQGPARVAGVDRRIGLDQLQAFIGKAQAVDIAVQAADNPQGHGALEAIGGAQGNGPVAHLQGFGIAKGGRP